MKRANWDIAVSAAIAGVAALVYWDALKYKPGTYDPLGSGAMPRMVAMAIVVLAAVAIIQSMIAGGRRARPAKNEGFQRRPLLALAIFGYMIVAATLMYWRVPFAIVGSLLLFASILSIKRGERAIIVPGIACSVAFGFGLSYLFGSVFGVDLP